MEKRIFGIILTVLGIAGLIYAASGIMKSGNTGGFKTIAVYGILGLIFFFCWDWPHPQYEGFSSVRLPQAAVV